MFHVFYFLKLGVVKGVKPRQNEEGKNFSIQLHFVMNLKKLWQGEKIFCPDLNHLKKKTFPLYERLALVGKSLFYFTYFGTDDGTWPEIVMNPSKIQSTPVYCSLNCLFGLIVI